MNNKYLTVLVLFLISSLMLTIVSATSDTESQNSNQEFKVGFDPAFPPFGYKDNNGDYTGFDIELAKEVCKRNNWTFSPQLITDWNSKDSQLNSGTFDCIWSEFSINGKEDQYTWSNAYYNNKEVFIVKSDSGIKSMDDIKNKNLEIPEGSSFIEDNKTIADNFASVKEVKDYNTTFTDLDSGKCDIILVDIGFAKYQMKENFNNDEFNILDEPVDVNQYGVAFKKGNDELRDQVQTTLDEMYKDGTVEKIAQKYSDYGIVDELIVPE